MTHTFEYMNTMIIQVFHIWNSFTHTPLTIRKSLQETRRCYFLTKIRFIHGRLKSRKEITNILSWLQNYRFFITRLPKAFLEMIMGIRRCRLFSVSELITMDLDHQLVGTEYGLVYKKNNFFLGANFQKFVIPFNYCYN